MNLKNLKINNQNSKINIKSSQVPINWLTLIILFKPYTSTINWQPYPPWSQTHTSYPQIPSKKLKDLQSLTIQTWILTIESSAGSVCLQKRKVTISLSFLASAQALYSTSINVVTICGSDIDMIGFNPMKKNTGWKKTVFSARSAKPQSRCNFSSGGALSTRTNLE